MQLICSFVAFGIATCLAIRSHEHGNLESESKPNVAVSPVNICNNSTQGILSILKDPQNLSSATNVTAILESKSLKLLQGNKPLETIKLSSVMAPILTVPFSDECLTIHHARNEVYGEPSIEEEAEDLEHIFAGGQEERKGVNIHIDGDVDQLPKVSVRYNK
ncbi:uncharacterized protein BdWA1_003767 [Babesia duncani]|uniref:Uncharacterized protein n=1 Tax=Babesia duncani TaxID=323732 RepID=A0AAD9UMJ1_9APIC|nr:hypothetical protein BdWA1_003767 [Babesia duncani]